MKNWQKILKCSFGEVQENVNLVQSDRSQSDMNCRLISSCRHRICINIFISYEHEATQINGAIDLGSTRLNATVLKNPHSVALEGKLSSARALKWSALRPCIITLCAVVSDTEHATLCSNINNYYLRSNDFHHNAHNWTCRGLHYIRFCHCAIRRETAKWIHLDKSKNWFETTTRRKISSKNGNNDHAPRVRTNPRKTTKQHTCPGPN